jgi:hypothetical protein
MSSEIIQSVIIMNYHRLQYDNILVEMPII